MKKLAFIALFFCFQFVFSQLKQTTFENVENQKNNKPTVVFIYADWCKYCHAMEAITFKNEEVIKILNHNFNFIKFNAEHKEEVNYLGNTFLFKPNGKKSGTHDLAMSLGKINGKLELPTTVVLNMKNEIIFQYASMLKPNELITILNTILTNEKN